MTLKITFLGDKNSQYTKSLKSYFDKVKNVKISTKSIVSYSDTKNKCFVSNMSSMGMLNSDADISYQALFPNIQMLLKRKLIDVNMFLFKNKVKPEMINNTPYLPVGSSIMVPLNSDNCFMIFSPTISYRNDVMNVDKYFYYFTRSIIRIVQNYNMSFNSNKVEELIFPQLTESAECAKHIFDAYFDVKFGLDNLQNTITTSTLFFNKAPLVNNYSFLPKNKKKIQKQNIDQNTNQNNNQNNNQIQNNLNSLIKN